jgi:hypothetical protein
VEHEEGSNFRTFQTSKSKQYIWYSTFAFGWICDQCIDIIVVPDLKRTKLNNWSYMGFKKMNDQRNDNHHLQVQTHLR